MRPTIDNTRRMSELMLTSSHKRAMAAMDYAEGMIGPLLMQGLGIGIVFGNAMSVLLANRTTDDINPARLGLVFFGLAVSLAGAAVFVSRSVSFRHKLKSIGIELNAAIADLDTWPSRMEPS